jgi:broad specificity phosphatase PhoE
MLKEIQNCKFYILRHGQTDGNLQNLVYGVLDFDINKNGVKQAEMTGKFIDENIHNLDIKTVVTSNLKRAINTANIATQNQNLESFQVPNLREYNFGELEGKADLSVELWMKWESGQFIGNGVESYQSSMVRVEAGFLEALEFPSPLIVAHWGTFYNLERLVESDDRIDYKNAGLYLVEAVNFKWTITEVFAPNLEC